MQMRHPRMKICKVFTEPKQRCQWEVKEISTRNIKDAFFGELARGGERGVV